MTRFIIRRLLAMVFVLFVISLLTFLLFEAIPNGNPAFRLAGRTATPVEIHQIEVKYGFNQPIWIQYLRTMKNIFTGQAYSYTQGFNVAVGDQGRGCRRRSRSRSERASSGCSCRSCSERWLRSRRANTRIGF